MLKIPAPIRVCLCTQPTDTRKQFDGLHGLVVEVLRQNPLSGDWFVFFNKRRDRIKVLAGKGDGLSIWYKRLESGTYAIPQHDGEALQLTSAQLALLLSCVDLRQTRSRRRYQPPG